MKQKIQRLENSLKEFITDKELINQFLFKIADWHEHLERFKENPKEFMENEFDFIDNILKDVYVFRKQISLILDLPKFVQINDELCIVSTSIIYEIAQNVITQSYSKFTETIDRSLESLETPSLEKPIGIYSLQVGTEKPELKKEIYNLSTYRKISEENGSIVLVTPSGQVERIKGISMEELMYEIYPVPKMPVLVTKDADEFMIQESKDLEDQLEQDLEQDPDEETDEDPRPMEEIIPKS